MNRITPKFRLQLLLAAALLTALAGGPSAIAQSVVATVPSSPPLWLILVLVVVAVAAVYWFVVQHKSVQDLKDALHRNTAATAGNTNVVATAAPAAAAGPSPVDVQGMIERALAADRASRPQTTSQVPPPAVAQYVPPAPQQAAPAPAAAAAPPPAPAQPAAPSAAPAAPAAAPQWAPPTAAAPAALAAPAAVLPPLNGTALFDMLVMQVTGQHNQALEDKVGGRDVMNQYKRDYGPSGRYADPELAMMAARAAGAITPPVFAWQGYFDRGQARSAQRADGSYAFVWDASMLGPFVDRYHPNV